MRNFLIGLALLSMFSCTKKDETIDFTNKWFVLEADTSLSICFQNTGYAYFFYSLENNDVTEPRFPLFINDTIIGHSECVMANKWQFTGNVISFSNPYPQWSYDSLQDTTQINLHFPYTAGSSLGSFFTPTFSGIAGDIPILIILNPWHSVSISEEQITCSISGELKTFTFHSPLGYYED